MELNGALSNPRSTDRERLEKLAALKERALGRGTVPERRSPIGRRQGAVLASVTAVLGSSGQPMFVREIHAAVEQLLGEAVPSSSVKEALSAHTHGGDGRFLRIRRGCYDLLARPEPGQSASRQTDCRVDKALGVGIARSANPVGRHDDDPACQSNHSESTADHGR